MKKRNIHCLFLIGITGAVIWYKHNEKNKWNEMKKLSDKHLKLFLMMNQWVKIKQQGNNISDYLESKGYKKIAVYGMSYAGETLIRELKESNVEIKYGIDKNISNFYTEIETVNDPCLMGDVDAIIVTAITFYNEINEALSHRVSCPIISLEDILHEI